MGLLDGQTAIITGAGNSVSRGIAKRFVIEGATVVEIHTEDEEELASAINAAAELHGRLDILVNAGQPKTSPARMTNKPIADFVAVLGTGPPTALRAMKAAYPHLRKNGGRVVNVGSAYGAMSTFGLSDALASDGALAGLTRAVGVEWAAENIFINYLQSGPADTPEFAEYRQNNGRGVEHRIGNLAIPRLADPVEDIGRAAVFLASDEA